MSSVAETILGAVGNAASGGLIGLVGTGIQGLATYFNSKAQFAHDEAMADKQLAASKTEDADKLLQINATAEGAAFASSLASTIGTFASSVLTVCREGIAFYLLTMSTVIYLKSSGDMQDAIGKDIVVMTSMAVAWHFGQKPASNFAARRALAVSTAPSTTTAKA